MLHTQAKSSAAPDKDKLDIKSLSQEFVHASAFILMKIKQNQQHDRNVNVLFTALEKVMMMMMMMMMMPHYSFSLHFCLPSSIHPLSHHPIASLVQAVHCLPDIDRGVLESIVPYAIFHQCIMEIGLSNQPATNNKGSLISLGDATE